MSLPEGWSFIISAVVVGFFIGLYIYADIKERLEERKIANIMGRLNAVRARQKRNAGKHSSTASG